MESQIGVGVAVLLSFTSAAAVVYLLLKKRGGSRPEDALEIARLNEALSQKVDQLEKLKAEAETLTKKLSAAEVATAVAETQARSMREALESEKQTLKMAEERLKDAFKSLAASALEGSTQQFLDLAKSQLSKETLEQKKEFEKTEASIQNLVKPLSSVLEKYQGQIEEIEKQRQRSYFSIENELKRVIENTSTLTHETVALKNALKKPHVRGRWGEVQLRNCVELAGMSEYADVTFQDATSSEDGQLHIPDMTVRMPGGRLIVVDSKTPIDAFLSSLEATSEEERTAEMARHGRHVKDHVKKLSSRAYSDALKDSPDFVVMFLPNESFLYAALESEPDLMEYALQKKVLITTPPTLIGLLKVIRFGWNEERLTENALRISEAGKELHKRLVEFVEGYVSVGKSLEKAKAEYDKGLNRLERRLITKAREMETLGVKSAKELPEMLGSGSLLSAAESDADTAAPETL